jgi:hypothetical protein
MRRTNHTLTVETPFGTFYGGFYATDGKHGPTFYAETESGEVTVNGVTYSGTVYAERFSHDGSLYLSCRHLSRWNDKTSHHEAASASACKKLAAVLLPAFEAASSDGDAVKAAKIRSLRSNLYCATSRANDEIGARNLVAAKLRELGENVPDIPKHENERES